MSDAPLFARRSGGRSLTNAPPPAGAPDRRRILSLHSPTVSDRRKRSRRAPKAPPAAAALRPVALDFDLPADEPLAPGEQAEMARHLKFLAEHRKLLRLRVNAAEDLMLNGAKPPTDRGLCKHLLGKVDRAAVEAALERLNDPRARSRFIGSVVQFSDDPGFLVAYLESLEDGASRREAAGAFAASTARLDFDALGEARMRRFLESIASIFEGPERAQVLFGLLHNDGFRAAFESIEPMLPPDLGKALRPLRAAYTWVIEGSDDGLDHKALTQGAALLLDAPSEVLRSYPAPVQQRLLERAVELMASQEAADRAAAALLEGLPHDSDAYRELALIRVASLLQQGAEPRAKWLLRQLLQAQPRHPTARRLLEGLGSPRVGPLALGWPGAESVAKAEPGLWTPAWWLAEQKRVWLRVGVSPTELALWDRAVGPGLAPVLLTKAGKGAFLAFAGRGVPAVLAPRVSDEHKVEMALQGVLILESLAGMGIVLPDARRKRFLIEDGSRLVLGDLSGARADDPVKARKSVSAQSFGFARELLRGIDLPPMASRAVYGRRSRPGQLRRALVLLTTP